MGFLLVKLKSAVKITRFLHCKLILEVMTEMMTTLEIVNEVGAMDKVELGVVDEMGLMMIVKKGVRSGF